MDINELEPAASSHISSMLWLDSASIWCFLLKILRMVDPVIPSIVHPSWSMLWGVAVV